MFAPFIAVLAPALQADALEIKDGDFAIEVSSRAGTVCRAYPSTTSQPEWICGVNNRKLREVAADTAAAKLDLVAVVVVNERDGSYLLIVLHDGQHAGEFDQVTARDYANAVRAAAHGSFTEPTRLAAVDVLQPTERRWNGIQVLGMELPPSVGDAPRPDSAPSLYFAAATARGIYTLSFVTLRSSVGHTTGIQDLADRTLSTLRGPPAPQPTAQSLGHWLNHRRLYVVLGLVALLLLVVVLTKRKSLPSRTPPSAPPAPPPRSNGSRESSPPAEAQEKKVKGDIQLNGKSRLRW
ncbi:hypothetical protein LVJ94_17205 [Pendulispora rubella]|uniref:Uncharacterized protein n=1 Tax=Pendulispora rubella TaxID=2741070 RepID=A0ABZ2LDV1_9BACT